MAPSVRSILFPKRPARSRVRLPQFVKRVLDAGIVSDDPFVRRRQLFTNILAYVAASNATIHFISNALHDFVGLLPVNIYNVLIFLFFLANHRLHRYGPITAAVTLIVGIVIGHSYVIVAFGTASHMQIYLTLAGFILFIVGVENLRVFLALYALALAALILTFFYAPEMGFVIPGDTELRRLLAFESLMNAIVINGVVIYAVVSALSRAEKALQREHQRSETLLTTIMPSRIAERLKDSDTKRIADRVENGSVLFIDLVGFTPATSSLDPASVVACLDTIFSDFDALCTRHGVDKIKTIGDAYMAVGGLEGDPGEGARAIGYVALGMLEAIERAPLMGTTRLSLRAGIHVGPVTAGVIGDIRMTYDVWGETVNTASRMESHGTPGRIQVSEAYREVAEAWFDLEERGTVEVKGLGPRRTWFLLGPKGTDDATDKAADRTDEQPADQPLDQSAAE